MRASVLWGVVAAVLAAAGVYLLYTSAAYGWRGMGPRTAARPGRPGRPARQWLTQAGLGEVGPGEFGAAVGLLGVVGGLSGFVLFGGWVARSSVGYWRPVCRSAGIGAGVTGAWRRRAKPGPGSWRSCAC